MPIQTIRDFSKRGDATSVPNLTQVQRDAYERFLQKEKAPNERDTTIGIESLLREVFPIESFQFSCSKPLWSDVIKFDFKLFAKKKKISCFVNISSFTGSRGTFAHT